MIFYIITHTGMPSNHIQNSTLTFLKIFIFDNDVWHVKMSNYVNCNISCYYMASSMSGEDEPNPALWLVPRVGKMMLACPFGTTCCVPQENIPQKLINPLSTKLLQSGWLDTGLIFFLVSLARAVAFFFWARHFTLTVLFPSQVCLQNFMYPGEYAEG